MLPRSREGILEDSSDSSRRVGDPSGLDYRQTRHNAYPLWDVQRCGLGGTEILDSEAISRKKYFLEHGGREDPIETVEI